MREDNDTMNGRERVMAMLKGEPVDRLPCMPITMQFAADLVGVKFLDYAIDHRRMVEGQVRVSRDFDFDYVNTMSDPACEAFDVGAVVQFFPNQPPALDENEALLGDKRCLSDLQIPDATRPGRMHNRLQALRLYRQKVGGEKVIEGWVEGPCAEGADLRGINALMTDFYDDPAFVRDLFDFCVEMELRFAREQVAAGAEVIGIGDAAASLVGPKVYEEFVLPFEQKLVDGIHALGVPVRMHICGDTRRLLPGLATLGIDLIDIDYPVPLEAARETLGPKVVLMGNLDPVRVVRDGTPDSVYEAVAACHAAAGERFIVAAGCEIPRDTPHANVHAMVEYARDHKPSSGAPLAAGTGDA